MTLLLRLLQMLAITIWVGGLIFFAFILAPVAFHTLPSIHEAGLMVGAALRVFDKVSMASGIVFLASTAVLSGRAAIGKRRNFEMQFLLVGVMLVATAYIHFNILPTMEADRARAGGDINGVAPADPSRIDFDKLHVRSERTEGGILLLGVAVIVLMSNQQVRLD